MLLKRLSLVVLILLCFQFCKAQNPTLSVGLETLTMNKGTIDVEALTAIIMEKQKALKQEALKRFILNLFPETNYTSKFYVQNCLTILLNEKNPKVIEKEVLELTTNYALVLGVAKAYNNRSSTQLLKISYTANSQYIDAIRGKIFKQKLTLESKSTQSSLEKDLKAKEEKIDAALKYEKKDYTALSKLEAERSKIVAKISRKALRMESQSVSTNLDTLPFSILVDVVAATLSDIPTLKSKGFFRKSIDYRGDDFYLSLKNSHELLFKAALDKFQNDLKKSISPYIEHYDVIKEFFASGLTAATQGKIQPELIEKYVNEVIELAGGADKITIPLADRTRLAPQALIYLKKFETFSTKRQTLIDLQNQFSRLQAQKIQNRNLIQDTLDLKDNLSRIDTLSDSLSFAGKELLLMKINTARKKQVDLASQFSASYKSLKDKLATPALKELNISLPKGELQNFEVDRQLGLITTLIRANSDSIKVTAKEMVKSGAFLKAYLEEMLAQMAQLDSFRLPLSTNPLLSAQEADYSAALSDIFIKLSKFSRQETISLKDIYYLDQEVTPTLIKFGLIFPTGNKSLAMNIQRFRLLSGLLKIQAISKVSDFSDYDSQLSNLFAFISNLDHLDQAESYQYMINLLQDTNEILENNLEDGKFKDIYMLFSNAVKKYTIINTQEQYVNIDVVSFLNDLQQYFDKNNNSRFGIYFTLGLNQNLFLNRVTLEDGAAPINNIGFASEKLGVKYRIASFRKVRGYENSVKNDVHLNTRAPFVNELYAILYGSGLLYSIANTSTDAKFDYPHIGAGFGLRFFNALDLNLIAGFPFIKSQPVFKNTFFGIGLDIPLGEYLEKISKKTSN